MKKYLIVLSLVLAVSLVGCNSDDNVENNNQNTSINDNYEQVDTSYRNEVDNETQSSNTTEFTDFTRMVDDISMDVMNARAELKVEYNVNDENVTDEQIYMEIATGSSSNSNMIGNCVNISDTNNKLSKELPEINGSKKGWYITSNGDVFNVSGVEYLGQTYFSALLHENGVKSYKDNDIEMAQKIANTILNGNYEVK